MQSYLLLQQKIEDELSKTNSKLLQSSVTILQGSNKSIRELSKATSNKGYHYNGVVCNQVRALCNSFFHFSNKYSKYYTILDFFKCNSLYHLRNK